MRQLLFILLPAYCFSTTLIVPTDYPNIQAGIDAAMDGDTVLVLDGIYSGPGNYNIELNCWDRALTVLSKNGPDSCIVDCGQLGNGFTINVDEREVNLSGFTIQNCFGDSGGGIKVLSSFDSQLMNPAISRCIINNNSANWGGGISVIATPKIENCLIINNDSTWGADGIYGAFALTDVSIYNSIIYDDVFIDDGGEYYSYFCLYPPDYEYFISPIYNIAYIQDEPMFVDEDSWDFHLQLQSPCINAGDITYPPDPDGTVIDIGPLYYELDIRGDLNFDEIIDILDILLCVNIVLNNLNPFNAQFWAADLDDNWDISVLDVLMIVDIIVSG